MLAALEARFELERCVKRLDDAFSPPVTALEDPRHAPALRGSGIGGRQIDPGDLEQGDLVVGGIHVALDRGCKTRQQRRPQHRLIRRKRLGQPNRVRLRVVRNETRGVGLRETGADQRLLDEPAQPLLLR